MCSTDLRSHLFRNADHSSGHRSDQLGFLRSVETPNFARVSGGPAEFGHTIFVWLTDSLWLLSCFSPPLFLLKAPVPLYGLAFWNWG